MNNPSLLPCPFCGNEAEAEKTLSGAWAIYCAQPIRMGGCFGRMDGYTEKSDAIAAWNRREDGSGKALGEAVNLFEKMDRASESEFNEDHILDKIRTWIGKGLKLKASLPATIEKEG